MRILIVDDEPGLASGLAQWLGENGWETPGVALSSDAAVEWINQNGGPDVLVCDVVMEPSDGLTLRETLQPHLPQMKTIFISGYDLSDYAERMAGAVHLPKPVTGEMLDQAIRKLFQPVAARAVVSATPRVVAATAKPTAAGATPRAAAAVPRATVKPAASTSYTPDLNTELQADELIGTTLGNYQIEAKIGQGSQGGIYRAKQINMGRQVRFYVLDRQRAQDPTEIQRFISNASVKANVSHPYILAVYEAGQSGGIYFYSCEYIPCQSLRQIRDGGAFLDELTALQAMKVATEVLAYFQRENISHELINENSILLGAENQARIANIAAHEPADVFDSAEEIRQLGRIMAGTLPENSTQLGVRALTVSMATGESGYTDLPAVAQAVAALEPAVAPEDAFKIDAQERAAIRMVEESKKRARRNTILNSALSLGILCAVLFTIYWFLVRSKSADVRDLEALVKIPAGEFIYQQGETVNLPEFYIDQYEVTIGQYAQFLDYLAEHPEEEPNFAHEKQPKGKSHVPVGWADRELATGEMKGYYSRAKGWGRFEDAALDVNSPVFGVDWFDAYAYAKWKGRRLPTEQEWEKAARGTKGFKYPWGDEPDNTKINSGADVYQGPKAGGEKDGFKKWSPVDAKKEDKSPFGIQDMAGNVSEWTASYDVDPNGGKEKIPVIRGGNWRQADYLLTRRVLLLAELQSADSLGFRTVSDNPPSKK